MHNKGTSIITTVIYTFVQYVRTERENCYIKSGAAMLYHSNKVIYNNDNFLQQNMIWWLLNRNKWACVLVYLHVKHQMAHTIVTFLIFNHMSEADHGVGSWVKSCDPLEKHNWEV